MSAAGERASPPSVATRASVASRSGGRTSADAVARGALEPPKGRSGIGLLAFAVLALVAIIFVAAVAFAVGHQFAVAEATLRSMP